MTARRRVTHRYRRDLRKANKTLKYATGITNRTRRWRDRELAVLRDLHARNRELETVLRDKHGHTEPVKADEAAAATTVKAITLRKPTLTEDDKDTLVECLPVFVLSGVLGMLVDILGTGDSYPGVVFLVICCISFACAAPATFGFCWLMVRAVVHNRRLARDGDAPAPTLTEAETRIAEARKEETRLLEQISVIRTRTSQARALAAELERLASKYEAEDAEAKARIRRQAEREEQARLRATAEETVDAMLDATAPSTDLERFDKEMRAIAEADLVQAPEAEEAPAPTQKEE